MAKRLSNKVAIVTGAARGIGKGILSTLVENGAKAVFLDQDEDNGKNTELEINNKFKNSVTFIKGNVSLKKDNEKIVKVALNTYGKLDIICANAGIYPLTWIKDISENEWDSVININLRGPFFLLQSALNHFMENMYGKVIFTSSITGTVVSASGHAHYSATKAGLLGLVKAAAIELSQYNINVNAIVPGNVMSEGMRIERGKEYIKSQSKSIPLGRLAETNEIGNLVAFLASDESTYITGQGIVIDGGQTIPENQDEVFHPKK